MPTIALESHYWDSQPHRPACITVRDDAGRIHTQRWLHKQSNQEEEQHYNAVRGWLVAHHLPAAPSVIHSARWRTGWRHIVALPPEDTPC